MILLEIEEKWQNMWEKARIFYSDPNDKKKFFVNFPYPYVNGFMHLGHSFSLMRAEVFARYKRMCGYNAIFPFGFHATGTPIVAAAERVRDGEKSQIDILEKMEVPKELIPKFSDPEFWVTYFPEESIKDLKLLGLCVDWRRSFITTSLNPYYDKFIRWQFNKLKEKNFVVKGEHPVTWCPKCNNPIGDHARLEGEGITPEEIILLKFKFDGKILPAATYRVETVFGATNMWMNPDVKYIEAEVDGEIWIISPVAADKLTNQKHKVKIIRELNTKELIGKSCVNPLTGDNIPILPATFVSPSIGTGVVMSVPSHAPYDYIALKDIQTNPSKYGVSEELVKNITPISLIVVEDFGKNPAIEISEKMGISSQEDVDKLEEATNIIYKKEFHQGILNERTGKYKGIKVSDVKKVIVTDFINDGVATLFHELPGKVVCRCLTQGVVKIVSDQWFLAYGSPEWKDLAKKCLAQMNIYPEKARKQFEYVLDWLKDWACTREFGLGTKLPWDEKWIIESLSDSTIYMAYYTLAKYFEDPSYKIDSEKLDDYFFDYIFLSKGSVDGVSAKSGLSKELISDMKKEFEYWYPFDFRNSGKDLIQNHLSFCIFNHAAIFPEKLWPKGFGVNGWVLVDGEKMSKSKGNFYTIKQIVKMYGADSARITLMNGGEGLDDPNWDSEFARTVTDKLKNWQDFCIENYGKGRNEKLYIDRWFLSTLDKAIKETTEAMEDTNFRTALSKGFFDLQRDLKWYLKRCLNSPNKEVISEVIKTQTLMLTPFTPHICEEIWEKLGFDPFISNSSWPEYKEEMIDKVSEESEKYIEEVVNDIREIISVLSRGEQKQLEKVEIFTAENWKWDLIEAIKDKANMGEAIKSAMSNENFRKNGKDVNLIIQRCFKNRYFPERFDEKEVLNEARAFLEEEFKTEIRIDSPEDPGNDRKKSLPRKPGIHIYFK
ncbi:MAG: leucine--tRNA ligase [Candidatus Methanofastidiosa archaeon]|nr:leucine--tRNA ligase [Candidatus Methanofastidiosa archaeon]